MLDFSTTQMCNSLGPVLPRGISGLERGKSVMSASVELTEGCFFDQMAGKKLKDGYLERVLRHGGNPNLEDADGNTPIAQYNKRIGRCTFCCCGGRH